MLSSPAELSDGGCDESSDGPATLSGSVSRCFGLYSGIRQLARFRRIGDADGYKHDGKQYNHTSDYGRRCSSRTSDGHFCIPFIRVLKRQDGCESAASLRSSSATRSLSAVSSCATGSGTLIWSRFSAPLFEALLTIFAGMPTAVESLGTSLTRRRPPRFWRDHRPNGPSTFAPAPTITSLPSMGCRLPQCLPVPPRRHALIDGAVIADLRSLADDDGAAVVNEHAFADFRAGVDFNPGQPAGDLTDRTGGKVFLPRRIMRARCASTACSPDKAAAPPRCCARRVAVADGADLVSDVRDGLSPRIDCFFRFFHPKGRIPIQIVFAIMHALSMRGLRN